MGFSSQNKELSNNQIWNLNGNLRNLRNRTGELIRTDRVQPAKAWNFHLQQIEIYLIWLDQQTCDFSIFLNHNSVSVGERNNFRPEDGCMVDRFLQLHVFSANLYFRTPFCGGFFLAFLKWHGPCFMHISRTTSDDKRTECFGCCSCKGWWTLFIARYPKIPVANPASVDHVYLLENDDSRLPCLNTLGSLCLIPRVEILGDKRRVCPAVEYAITGCLFEEISSSSWSIAKMLLDV